MNKIELIKKAMQNAVKEMAQENKTSMKQELKTIKQSLKGY